MKGAVETRGTRWKESKWNDWIKEVVTTVFHHGHDRDEAAAVALGLIKYGVRSKDEMRSVATSKEDLKRQLTAEAYGVLPAIFDLLFANTSPKELLWSPSKPS